MEGLKIKETLFIKQITMKDKTVKDKIIEYIRDEHFHLEKIDFKNNREPREMDWDDNMACVDSLKLEEFIQNL